jgi:ubiquitin-like protein Pup
MSQVQKNTSKQDETEEVEVVEHDVSEITDAADDLLDEIDGVLEENSQDFVSAFVQAGGE